MSYSIIPTVIGPNRMMPFTIGCNGLTNRILYRDVVQTWVSIYHKSMFKTDQKYKCILDTVVITIYRCCNDASKDLLNSSKKDGTMNVEGSDESEELRKSVSQVLVIIAEYSQYYKTMREVELIENLTSRLRKNAEDIKAFTQRFNNAVSLNTNNEGPLTPQI